MTASRRRRAVAVGAPVVCAAVTATALLTVPGLRGKSAVAGGQPGAVPVSAAAVVRTDLTSTVQAGGSLTYQGAYTVVNRAVGAAYTWLPAPGRQVRRGQRLYEVDGAPVVLFYGARPQWRPLAPGVPPGSDVAQLRANLIALGYGTGLAVSDYYDDATAAAVAAWQTAAGLPVTGTVPLGQVVYAPGPLRVAAVSAVLGAAPQPGAPLLTATSPVPAVLVPLPVSQEYLVRAGDQVTVTLPDGVTTLPGVITAISPVAAQDAGSPEAGASPGPGSGGSGNNQPTVQMTVKLTHPGAAGVVDQEPVTVNIVSAQAHGVLAVPVSALVALAGGGYAVDVVSGAGGATRTLVPVRTGLFASTLVQVSAPGLRAGQEVEVPAS